MCKCIYHIPVKFLIPAAKLGRILRKLTEIERSLINYCKYFNCSFGQNIFTFMSQKMCANRAMNIHSQKQWR